MTEPPRAMPSGVLSRPETGVFTTLSWIEVTYLHKDERHIVCINFDHVRMIRRADDGTAIVVWQGNRPQLKLLEKYVNLVAPLRINV